MYFDVCECMCVLVSFGEVYNCCHHIDRKFVHLTSSILVRKGVDTGNLQQLSQHLPEFLWLLRDVTLELPENKSGKQQTPTEYLRQNVLNENESDEVHPLLQLFPQLRGSVLPPPPKNPQKYPKDAANEDFLQAMTTTVENILKTIKAKKGFSGAVVNGPILVALIHEYENAINEPNAIPDLEVAWSNAIELHLSKVSDELAMEYATEMKKQTIGKLPLEEGHLHQPPVSYDTLFGIHHRIKDKCMHHLQEEIRRLLFPAGSEKLASPQLKETQERIYKHFSTRIIICDDSNVVYGGELFHFVQENYHKSVEQCNRTFESVYYSMQENVSMETLTAKYNREAVGPAKEAIIQEELKYISGPPLNICIVHLDPTKVILTWCIPEIHKQSAVTYEIQVRKRNSHWEGKHFWQDHRPPNYIAAQITGLSPNTEYSFRIRGKNERRCGEYSVILTSKTHLAPPKTPPKPRVEITSTHGASITIQGLEYGEDNGSAIDKIKLESGFISDSSQSTQEYPSEDILPIPQHFSLQHPVSLKSHDERGEIYYQVRFGNKAGYSNPSAQARVRTSDLIPSKPTTVEPTCYVTSITFKWKPPDMHPHAVESYEVNVRKEGESHWMTHIVKETSFTVSTLQAVTKYQYEIWTRGYHQRGEPCTGSVCTEAGRPSQPKEPQLQIIDYNRVSVAVRKLKHEDENGSVVTDVRIEKSKDQETWESQDFKVVSQQKEFKQEIELCTISSNGDIVTFMYYRVSMKNEKGWSDPSQEAQLEGHSLIPSAPQNVQVASGQNGTERLMLEQNNLHADIALTLTWTLPKFHPESVVCFVVKVRREKAQWATATLSSTSITVSALQPCTTYEYTIEAQNYHRRGKSFGGYMKTEAVSPCKPNKPILHVIDCRKVQVSVQRLKVEEENGSPVTHIKTEKSQDGKTWKSDDPLEIGNDSLIRTKIDMITKDSNDGFVTFFYYRVSMKNEKGWSNPSEVAQLEEDRLIPTAPMDLQVMEQESTYFQTDVSLTFIWKPPLLHPKSVQSYVFLFRKKGTAEWAVQTLSDTSVTMRSLQAVTKYEYAIQARNRDMSGGVYSSSVHTEAACPCQPKKPSLHIVSSQKVELFVHKLKTEEENGEIVTHMKIERSQNQIEWELAEIVKIEQNSPIKMEVDLCTRNTNNDVITFWYYRVSMRNKKGWSKPSEETQVLERDLIPSAPVDFQVMFDKSGAREMVLDQKGSYLHADISLTFKWKPPYVHTNIVKGYEVKIQRKGTVQWTVGTSSDTSLTVRPMQPKTMYEYEIRALSTHVKGEVIKGEVCTEAACPYQPQKPALRIISSQKVELTIEKLKTEEENGEPVTHMKIEKGEDQHTWKSLDTIEIKENSKIKVEVDLCTMDTNNDVVTFFYYRVSMKNAIGWSKPSEHAQLDKNKLIPSAPKNLHIIRDKCGPREIWLMWTKPLFHAHKVKGYSVIVNVDGVLKTFYSESVAYAIRETVPDALYHIYVKSLNIHGKGEFSERVSHTTPYVPPNPPLVKDIQTKSSTEAELHIQLQKLQRGEKPVTHIIVEKSANSLQWEHALEKEIICSDDREIALTVAYSTHMRVLLKSDVGVSEPCEPITIPPQEFVPGKPMYLRKTSLASTTVTLCWEKPQANALAARKYAIQMKKATENSWKTLYSVHEMKNEITELSPSSTVEFRVRAENDGAVGEYCQPCRVTTLPKTPRCPGIRMIDYKSANLIFQRSDFNGGTEMNIETCGAEYKWEHLDTVTYEETKHDAKYPEECYYTVQIPGMFMCLRSQLLNEELVSEYSDVTKLTAKDYIPGPPTELGVSERTSTSITLVWKEPKDDQHPQSVAFYEIVVIAKEDQFEKKESECGAKCTKCTITELRMATKYYFKMYACNEQRKKGECASIEYETLCLTPGPPINFRLAGAAQFRIKVRWRPPTDNADALDKYALYYRLSGTESKKPAYKLFAEYKSHKTSAVVTGLEAGTYYDFKICSMNKKGQKGEEAECSALCTKRSDAFKYGVGTVVAVATLGFGISPLYHSLKDDPDVKDSP